MLREIQRRHCNLSAFLMRKRWRGKLKLKDSIGEYEKYMSNKVDNNLYETSIMMYNTKVKFFIEYLVNRLEIRNTNLRKLTKDDILNSIIFYIENRKIKFIITVQNFFTAITSYFSYLRDMHGITNPNFNNIDDYESLRNDLSNIIRDYKLEKSSKKGVITEKAAEEILALADENILKLEIEKMLDYIETDGKNGKYYDFVSSLAIKILLLSGVKPNIILKINKENFDEDNLCLTINGYKIHLPYRLSHQLLHYIKLREKILEKNNIKDENYSLLIKHDGTEFNQYLYSELFKVMKSITNDTKAETISKYVIVKMIENDMDRLSIMKLTGFKSDTYFNCEEIVNELRYKDLSSKEINKIETRYMDSNIRALNIFDEL